MSRIILILFLSQLAFLNASPIQQEDNFLNQTLPEDFDKEKYQMVGDMIVKKVNPLSRSVGLGSRAKNWPNGVVPYEIASGYSASELSVIKRGMEILSSKTDRCITFVPRNSGHRNWITIKPGVGCNSPVGMNGYGSQTINLEKGGCTLIGTTVHELMHTIGFYHEQNRPDRDQYIRIDYDNVQDGLAFAFDKEYNTQYFNTPYDLKSIMQYYEYSFSKNGKRTIVPLNGEHLVPVFSKTEAQILTASDISSVKQLYKCSNSGGGGGGVVTNPPTNFSSYTFTLNNNLSAKVTVYWVNYSGVEVAYGTIYPGQSFSQSTYKSHQWRVRGTGVSKGFTIGEGKFAGQATYMYLSAL